MTGTSGVTHIAGIRVQTGQFVRQRCAWCGAVLEDYDLERLGVIPGPDGQAGEVPLWEVGGLVLVDGALSMALPTMVGNVLPDNACTRLDPAVTA